MISIMIAGSHRSKIRTQVVFWRPILYCSVHTVNLKIRMAKGWFSTMLATRQMFAKGDTSLRPPPHSPECQEWVCMTSQLSDKFPCALEPGASGEASGRAQHSCPPCRQGRCGLGGGMAFKSRIRQSLSQFWKSFSTFRVSGFSFV